MPRQGAPGTFVQSTRSPRGFKDFSGHVLQEPNFTISGVTRDKTGVALGGAAVDLFILSGNQRIDGQTSDAGGNYSFVMSRNQGVAFFERAYLAGAPDVAGTTRNDLAAGSVVDIYLRDPTVADGAGAPGAGYSRARVANMSG